MNYFHAIGKVKYIYMQACIHVDAFSRLCSDLPEILAIVFAANSVKYMLTDIATSRTCRWHLLVYGALNTILEANAYNVPVPESPDDNS